MNNLADLEYQCVTCRHRHRLDELAWRCGRCGGLLDLSGFEPEFSHASRTSRVGQGLWRYAGALPLPSGEALSMGEGNTPLVALSDRPGVALKLDYVMPTGSFKDRGAVMLAALGRQLGVDRMMADSSGNAGAALAAYAARAEVRCDIYLPDSTSNAKVGQLEAYGATVHLVPGSRADTAAAAGLVASEPGVLYASHVYNPFYFHGTKTYVFEIWEALGGRLPETLLLPVGNGTLVLGSYLGSRELLSSGLIDALPRIVAVQAAACAPLVTPTGDGTTPEQTPSFGPTIAEGIAIAAPPRREQILAAVRDTGGKLVAVSEDRIRDAHLALARRGFYVEPTSAVCFAAYEDGQVGEPAASGMGDRATGSDLHTVIPLTGTGLKSKPPAT